MWNIHGDPTYTNINLATATNGDNTIVSANTAGELFVHALSFTVDLACTVQIKLGSTVVGTFKLPANGTVNLADNPGMEGEPFYKLAKNNALILNVSTTGITLTGTVTTSTKN